MPHTYTNLLTHIIFSTRERLPLIHPNWRADLHAYLGGICRELECTARAIHGAADHVHLLVSLHPARSVAELLRTLKANFTRWVARHHAPNKSFAWQTAYSAFSVSQSSAAAVVRYIAGQEEHHRRVMFQEEYLQFLKKHGIDYDERYIWG
jgi:REP element-mobilizing transposase RayT